MISRANIATSREKVNHLVEAKLLLLSLILVYSARSVAFAQSIGYQPQFNLGFNPYMSPVFGYGLGLPFGANSFSPARYPFLLGAGGHHLDGHGLLGKVHAKAFLKKLATSQYGLYGHSLGDKVNLLKHPENALTPYGAGYGYGKHYGAAMVPNNPYKGAYVDYYDNGGHDIIKPKPLKSLDPMKLEDNHLASPTYSLASYKFKPLIKLGALLTTAALLGKKIHESPLKLNPAGMILSETQP